MVGERQPRTDLTLVIRRRSGEVIEVPVTCRPRHRRGGLGYQEVACCNASPRDFLASTAQKAVS